MPRTLLPRSALRNSAAVASRAPVDPVNDAQILGPASEPTTEPASQPSTQPSERPEPVPPADPKPKVLLVHPPATVLGAGLLGDAEGPIFARDPLMGAATIVITEPLSLPEQISLYQSIGRLVIFVRWIPRMILPRAITWNQYRSDFKGYSLPDVTEAVEFEAPHVEGENDIESLVNFAKMFKAPKCTMWTYGHGAEVLFLGTRGKKEKDIEKKLKPQKKFLLERTPDAAAIVAIAGAMPYFEVATEWFDPNEPIPEPPRPAKGVLRRAQGVRVVCKEGDYAKVDFNVGAKLQHIEVEVDFSIPLPPVK
jgi:hypothetical protein